MNAKKKWFDMSVGFTLACLLGIACGLQPKKALSAPLPLQNNGGGQIVFVSDRDGNDEIYVMNVDGTGVRRLTDHPAADSRPVWSPGGEQIVFQSQRDSNWDIYVMNADGSDLIRLTDDPADDTEPLWSSLGDTKFLIFRSNRDGENQLYTMDLAGTTVKPITGGQFINADVTPEVFRFAYLKPQGLGTDNYDLWTLALNNSIQVTSRLTFEGSTSDPAWSPDGSHIAFTLEINGDRGIYVADYISYGGSNPNLRDLTTQTTFDMMPAWSSDGTKIAFVSERDGNQEIYIMDTSGSDVRRLTDNPARDFYPDWGPGTTTAEPVAQTPTSALEPTLGEATSPASALDAELLISLQAPVVALVSDSAGFLYAVIETGDILQITPDGQSNVLYTGLTRCGFSLTAATMLPDGHLVVNTCIDEKDALLEIDQAGTATPLISLDENLIAMTSDPSGRIYLGFWLSEGDLTLNFQPFTYLGGADHMSGQVATMEPDGALTIIYEGGLPFSLSPSQDGTVFASIWGQSGRFRAENKEYQTCDLRTALWITLSDQTEIARIANQQALPVSTGLLAAADLSSRDELLFAVGRTEGDECGIYRIAESQEPVKLLFTEDGVDQKLTSLLVSGTWLYFANVNGDVYRATLDIGEAPPSTAVVVTQTPVPPVPTPTAAPTQAPSPTPIPSPTPEPAEPELVPIVPANVDHIDLLNQFSVPWIRDLEWSPDGTRLTVVSEAGMWHFSQTGLEQEFDSQPTPGEPTAAEATIATTPISIAYGPDGTLVVLGDALDNTVRLVDATTGDTFYEMTGHTSVVVSVAFSPQYILASAGFGEQTVRLWDAITGESLGVLEGHSAPVTSVAFSPNGMLASGSQDQTAILWNVDTGEMIRKLDGGQQPVPAENLAFSPDGSKLAWAGIGGVVFWDVETGEYLGALDNPFSASGLSWSPEGNLVAVGTVDGQIIFLNPVTGETIATLETQTSFLENLAFNPDGTILAAGSQGGTIMLWGTSFAPQPDLACDMEVASLFADSYFGDDTLPGQLGCPIGAEQALYLVYQPFERGQLYLRETGDILALLDDGRLAWGIDVWQEGMPIDDPSLVPPPDLLQPTRGLGLFWRSSVMLRDAIGWATAPEVSIATVWQDFEHGAIFLDANIQSHALLTLEGRHVGPEPVSSSTTEPIDPYASLPTVEEPRFPVTPPQQIEDSPNDVTEPYIDVVGFAVSLEGETLEAVFTLRDIPPEMIFNREEMPKDEAYYEYFWSVYVYLDPAHADEDYSVKAYYPIAIDEPAFTGSLADHVKVFVGKYEGAGRSSRIDTPYSIEVDTEANTITLRADIPGITESAVVSFQTYDHLAESRADLPD